MPTGVFISYSHEDKALVSRVVTFVRALRDDLVFQDTDLKPGKPWEPQLETALNEAKMVLVFWCEHASASEYVRKEYEKAIQQHKDVMPLLLDDSPLSEPLKAYQWVDFRKVVKHRRSKPGLTPMSEKNSSKDDFFDLDEVRTDRRIEVWEESKMPKMSKTKSFQSLLGYLLWGGLIVASFLLFYYFTSKIPFIRGLKMPWRIIIQSVGWFIVVFLVPFIIYRIWKEVSLLIEVRKLEKEPKAMSFDNTEWESRVIAGGIVEALNKRMPKVQISTGPAQTQ